MYDASHNKIKLEKGEKEEESWQLLTLETEVKRSKKIEFWQENGNIGSLKE